MLRLGADGQPLAALRAPAFEDETTILRTHPHQKTVRPAAVAPVGLKCAFTLHVCCSGPNIPEMLRIEAARAEPPLARPAPVKSLKRTDNVSEPVEEVSTPRVGVLKSRTSPVAYCCGWTYPVDPGASA